MVSLAPAVRASTATTPKSIKPALRRANLSGTIRKIDDTDLDVDMISRPSSPSKKARVTFNPDVQEKVMVEYTAKGRSIEVIRAEVRRALEKHARLDSDGLDAIKQIFANRKKDDDDDEEQENEEEEERKRADIRTYVIALTSYASQLNKSCSALVQAVIRCDWLGRDEPFIKAYVQFLGSLASSQGAYVGPILEMLVVNFYGVRFSSGRLPGYPDVNRDKLYSRVHVAIKYLLRLIPSASGILSPIISKKFPDSEESRKVHVTYIENLIRLIEYTPELKSDVFALITDKVVKIDVEMQVRLDDIENEVSAAVVEAISMGASGAEALEGDDSDSDAESVTSEEDSLSDAKRIKQIKSNVEKMDAILDILFAYYSKYFTDPNSIEAATMFETLLSHFANIILPTYRSRHTQFLLFHFAQTADHLVDHFAGTCVQLAFDKGRPAILRQSAASYLASFVARGQHVEPHVVLTVFELIGTNLDHIRLENEVTCRGPDLKRYGTFYAMTQALLYIFCFRWRDLLATPLDEDDEATLIGQDLDWAGGIKETLRTVIYSKLNPLKVCSPIIVEEFAKIARHLRFMYVYPLLETNKRVRLSQFSSVGTAALLYVGHSNNEGWHQLEAHFPFDPYHLPVSKRWVEDDYVDWRPVPGLEPEEDDEDDSEDDEDEEEVEVEDDTATDDE